LDIKILMEKTSYYLTTDGFLDQNGGEKDFMFGKERFKKLILDNYNKPMNFQIESFEEGLNKYKGNENQRDDITVLGFRI